MHKVYSYGWYGRKILSLRSVWASTTPFHASTHRAAPYIQFTRSQKPGLVLKSKGILIYFFDIKHAANVLYVTKNSHIIFSDGEFAVHPLPMVPVDNIFEATFSHTQLALAADLRIDISYFPIVNSQSIRYQWYGSTFSRYQSIWQNNSSIRSQNFTKRTIRRLCMRQYWTTIVKWCMTCM
jgi:hypothetical protein